MSFGKRNIDKSGEGSARYQGYRDIAVARPLDTQQLSRLLVISVAAIVLLAAVSALVLGIVQSGRGEPVQVEASLVDGSMVAVTAHSSVVKMCIEQGTMAATRSVGASDGIARGCECTVAGLVDRLTPLQMQMLYVDYRTRLRATLAAIDRTGERFAVDGVPMVDRRDGAAVALIAADRYEAHWREARGLVQQQAARCQSQ